MSQIYFIDELKENHERIRVYGTCKSVDDAESKAIVEDDSVSLLVDTSLVDQLLVDQMYMLFGSYDHQDRILHATISRKVDIDRLLLKQALQKFREYNKAQQRK